MLIRVKDIRWWTFPFPLPPGA